MPLLRFADARPGKRNHSGGVLMVLSQWRNSDRLDISRVHVSKQCGCRVLATDHEQGLESKSRQADNVRKYLDDKIKQAQQAEPGAVALINRYVLSEVGFLWISKRRKKDVQWWATTCALLNTAVGCEAVLEKARGHVGTAIEVMAECVDRGERFQWLEAHLIKLGVRAEDVGICRHEVADCVRTKIERLRSSNAFDGWLRRVAGSVARKYRRVHNREAQLATEHDIPQLVVPHSDILGEVWPRLSAQTRSILDAYRGNGRLKDVAHQLEVTRSIARSRFRTALVELAVLLDPIDVELIWVGGRTKKRCKYNDLIEGEYDLGVALRNKSGLTFEALVRLEVDGEPHAAIPLNLTARSATEVFAIRRWVGTIGEHRFGVQLLIQGKQVRFATVQVHIGTCAVPDSSHFQPLVERTTLCRDTRNHRSKLAGRAFKR
jgi:hypothetical protein